jgi:hypothetical protein
VPGDYDGDGRDNMAVFQPSTGFWFTSLDPSTNWGSIRWGTSGDIPAPGDYDGDGRIDVAVYRQGNWYVYNTSTSAPTIVSWGVAADRPVPAAYVP